MRILALRVEFVRDTLSTTTGDGRFAYRRDDSLYEAFEDTAVIRLDPPPHDSLYFADHLEFLRFYWREMSRGAVDLEWDVYPAGPDTAYRLPKQMWQYNWNYTERQLDRGLAELFRDAVTAADADPAVVWEDYGLVVVFHAGAGAEFDLGYTTTPHDIPSAWMVKDDFQAIGLDDGVPVGEEPYFIDGGLILPETESHEGVQISMAGVMVSLFGHWLGLPALYDRDDGDPVVGKWSLMDRGFGNFYGAIPGPVDAWSRSYLGWLQPVEIAPGDYAVAARGFAEPDTAEAYRIPVTPGEYFLLECRARDPENDSIAVGWDRNGRRMVFNEDYSVTPDPGFRVPVRIDNLDFDSPGSGILIWHVAEACTTLIARGRFNSVDELRGLDLEEADGAQDIGRNYPFLTPGYGTDYGIYADAWYFDNRYHQDANGGRQVGFNDYSHPSSRANSGAFTHIEVENFSRRAPVMTFTFARGGFQFTGPVTHRLPRVLSAAVGDFDADGCDELVVLGRDRALFYDGTGELIQEVELAGERNQFIHNVPVVRDINGNRTGEVVWVASGPEHAGYLNALVSGPLGGYHFATLDTLDVLHPRIAFGGNGLRTVLCLAGDISNPNVDSVLITAYGSSLEKSGEMRVEGRLLSLHRFGSASSDTFLITTMDGDVYFWQNLQLICAGRFHELSAGDIVCAPVLADFDNSGGQDLVFFYRAEGTQRETLAMVHDPGTKGVSEIDRRPLFYPVCSDGARGGPIPADIDGDGGYELIAFGEGPAVLALEANGNLVDTYPRRNIQVPVSFSKDHLSLVDLDGDGGLDLLYTTRRSTLVDESSGVRNYEYFYAFDALASSGGRIPGFPVGSRIDHPLWCGLSQMDDDPQLELWVVSGEAIDACEVGAGGSAPSVWWQGEYRDGDHSNAVWESAVPFRAPPWTPLLPAEQCYNWPNPARGWTSIRYTLSAPATVKVDIFDITGERVTTLHGSGTPGLPSEIIWNLDGVARGGYIAVIKAQGGGRSETRTVKIAVVK